MLRVIAIVLLLVILAFFVGWIVVSKQHYTDRLLGPGAVYAVEGRTYTMPMLPVHGDAYLLKPSFITSLRDLLHKSTELLDTENIPYVLTGGTLLGAVRQQTIPLPYDDDVDVGVDVEHRTLLFSKKFSDKAKERGLRVIFLANSSDKRADARGAACRIQRVGGSHETLDIFFWKRDHGKYCKIDSWYDNKDVLSDRECFDMGDVFPRQRLVCDGLDVCLPANPTSVLKTQYGDTVFGKILARPRLVSHAFPFVVGAFIWTTH